MKKNIFFIFLISGVFMMLCVAYAKDVITGTISGQVMLKDGNPMRGGLAVFFNDGTGPPPDSKKYWRVPDHIVKIDENGRFSADLPEGTYYVGAIKRMSGETIGPPREGDYFVVTRDDRQRAKGFVVKAGKSIDTGIISGAEPFHLSSTVQKDVSAVEGTITYIDGTPVSGAVVSAFRTMTETGKPVFSSLRTGSDGKYSIRVQSGSYYLRARSVYGGGPPLKGEVIGAYGEKEPVSVTVKEGEIIKGVDIKVIKFSGRGPKKE